MSKQILLTILVSVLLLISNAAKAGLEDSLDSMFSSIVVPPDYVESQRGGVANFGTARFRAPNRGYNIAHFSPPRFSAGCGGIDMYLGSFSFINADQFRAMLRQIASQALGYAFNLALKEMCSACASVLESLRKTVAHINEMAKDTCGMVKAAFRGTGLDDGIERSMQWAKLEKEENGIADQFETWATNLNDWDALVPADKTPQEVAEENRDIGNSAQKVLRVSNVDLDSSIVGMTNTDIRLMLYNIMGFKVINPGTPVSTDTSSNVKKVLDKPRISVADLAEGNRISSEAGDIKQIWDCDFSDTAPECYDVVERDWTFPGTLAIASSILLGDPNADETDRVSTSQYLNDEQSAKAHILEPSASTISGATSLNQYLIAARMSIWEDGLNFHKYGEPAVIKYLEAMVPVASIQLQISYCSAITDMFRRISLTAQEKPDGKIKENMDKFVSDCKLLKGKLARVKDNAESKISELRKLAKY